MCIEEPVDIMGGSKETQTEWSNYLIDVKTQVNFKPQRNNKRKI